jgi:outer membrane protein assembly factor BamB
LNGIFTMRGKLYFTIYLSALHLLCLIQFLPAQNVLPASDWNAPFQKCWEFETSRLSVFPPLTDKKQTIFQILDDGTLTAIDAASGKTVWRSQFGGEIVSNAFFEDSKLYLVSKIIDDEKDSEFVLRTISAATGLTLWQKSFPFNESGKLFVSSGNNSIIIVSDTGQILLNERTAGAEAWRKDLPTEITSVPFLFENKIFIGTVENKFLAFSVSNGEIVFKLDLPHAPTGNLFVSVETLVVGDRAGNILAFRLADRKLLWKARTGAQIVDITEVSGNFLVSSNDGFVYLLAARNGDRIWKRRLAGRPIGKPPVSNNYALLQTIDGGAATILDLVSGKTVNQIFLGENVFSAGGAVFIDNRIVIPTNKGLLAFSQNCTEK